MQLPTGLLSVYVLALTVGISAPTTVAAELYYRLGDVSFTDGLSVSLFATGLVYLVGVAAVWLATGAGALWGTTAALVVTGVGAFVLLAAVPLRLGQTVLQFGRSVDDDTALRYATYGWPVAMAVAFVVFVAPGGSIRSHVFQVDSASICLAGHCGLPVVLVAVGVIELLVTTVGPGVIGLLLYSWSPPNEISQTEI